eukprot:gene5185-5260_t
MAFGVSGCFSLLPDARNKKPCPHHHAGKYKRVFCIGAGGVTTLNPDKGWE